MTTDLTALTPAPLSGVDHIRNLIAELQQKLQTQAPGYESLLQRIHLELHKNEDAAHLLKPEEIGTVIAALAKRKNIVIAEVEKKSGTRKAANGKSLKEVSISDL